jgi:hypothetical protein
VEYIIKEVNINLSQLHKVQTLHLKNMLDKCYNIFYRIALVNKFIVVCEIYERLVNKSLIQFPITIEDCVFLRSLPSDITNMIDIIKECLDKFSNSSYYFEMFLDCVMQIAEYYKICEIYAPPVQLHICMLEILEYMQ